MTIMDSSSIRNKRKRADPPTLGLKDSADVDQYFFEVPYFKWSLESFCRYSFESDHRQKATDIASSFLSSTRIIKDSEEVPTVIRTTAEPLSRLKRARIKCVWQELFLVELTTTAKARSDGYEAAKEDFQRAATLTEDLLNQLEDGKFVSEVAFEHDGLSENCSQFNEAANGGDGDDALSNHSLDSDTVSLNNTGDIGVTFLQATFSDFSDETEFIPNSEDHTGSSAGIFSDPPEKVNWIDGSGSASSQLRTAHLWIDRDVNISQLLAQRDNVMRALENLEDADMLSLRNFIYPPRIVHEVLSIEQWTESISQWDEQYHHTVSTDEVADIITIALAVQTHTTHQKAVDALSAMDTTKPMARIISDYLRTAEFWSTTVFDRLSSKSVNEDTFINNAVKPIMDGLFESLPHITMHWTRDEIKCGNDYKNEERLYPDFHISIKNQSIVLLEAKPPSGTAADYKADRRKLFDEMKLAVDGLLRRGIDKPVVGFLVSGFRVETFAMTLDYEACYLPVDLGSFDLIASRFQFGNMLTAAKPLLTALDTVTRTLAAMYGIKGEPIKQAWTRGTYHTKPIKIRLNKQ